MSNYTSEDITVLSDVQHMRTRPGMYIGETIDPRALFNEGYDNAVDEAQSGYSNLSIVQVDTKNHKYTIKDTGRGIPHGKKEIDGKLLPTMQVLCTKSFSGGKFDNANYRISSGLHGLGQVCINSLSTYFKEVSIRDNEKAELIASKGEITSYEECECNDPSGTSIEFIADPDIFDSIDIPMDHIINRCKTANAFGYATKLYIDDKEYHLPSDSVLDLIPEDDANVATYATMIFSSKLEDGQSYTVGLKYTSETSYKPYAYSNLLYNSNGGTHSRLFWKGICEVWSEFSDDEAEIDLKYDDCTLGLRTIFAVSLHKVAFSSQVKDKLTVPNDDVQPLVDEFKLQFRKYLKDNPEIRKALIKRFVEYRVSKNRLSSRKEIMSLVQVSKKTSNNKVHRKAPVKGLIECTSTELIGTELYLFEGLSAAGPAGRTRNKQKQSILPMRGKIKNVTWMSIVNALKSEDVLKVINAIGAGVGEDCDPTRCRYERIIISVDADPDGKNIAVLFINLLVQLTPALVKDGRVYVLNAPLFAYTENGIKHYCDEFSEIPEKLRQSHGFSRFKGLGEMSDEEFHETCLVPGARTLYQVTYPDDMDKFNHIMGTSEGKHDLLVDQGILQRVSVEDDINE